MRSRLLLIATIALLAKCTTGQDLLHDFLHKHLTSDYSYTYSTLLVLNDTARSEDTVSYCRQGGKTATSNKKVIEVTAEDWTYAAFPGRNFAVCRIVKQEDRRSSYFYDSADFLTVVQFAADSLDSLTSSSNPTEGSTVYIYLKKNALHIREIQLSVNNDLAPLDLIVSYEIDPYQPDLSRKDHFVFRPEINSANTVCDYIELLEMRDGQIVASGELAEYKFLKGLGCETW
jgi:hypothetical protein